MFLFENNPPWAKNTVEKPEVLNLSRRDFLKRSALLAGSTFVLGVWSSCETRKEPMVREVTKVPASGTFEEAGFQPNLLVGINDAGDVFIVCTRSEMGQGIRSSMPPVIADEMEADWDRVHVVQADGDPKYGNQNTDGSRSVRNHFDEWRQAGATARAMLLAAAAKMLDVPASECTAHNNFVEHSASQRKLGYGELAATAATLDVPADAPLKDRSEWRYIGKEVRGVDNYDIVTGKAIFGIDASVPGMLHATIERCPVIGGKALTYDEETATAVPGVEKVLRLDDAQLPPAFNALGGIAVIGTNTWATMKGREALNVKWDFGPNAGYNSTEYRAALENSATNPGKEIRAVGDIKTAMEKASQTHEATYFVPMQAHAPMEPPNALAWVKEDGSIEIWAPSQDPQAARNTVAAVMGVEVEQVTIHVTLLGGGFGRKSKPDYVVEAALISKAVGAPVKLTWTREDEIHFDYFHAPSAQHLKASLDETGKATGWLHRTTFPSISSTFAPNVTHASNGELGLGFTTVPYQIPNMLCENGAAKAFVRIGWLRSVCNIHHAFAVNAFAGELAHKAGRDQKDYLLELIGPPRNLNHLFEGERGAYGEDLNVHTYDTGRLRHVIEAVATSIDWGKDLPDGHGLGIATHYSFVSYVAHAVHVSVIDGQLAIHDIHCAIDSGTYVNVDRVKAQMEGATIFGLTLALHGKITAKDGAIEQSNFHNFPLLRLNETPPITVHVVHRKQAPGGVGEPGVPPVAPALTNAILAATGKPVRELPIRLG